MADRKMSEFEELTASGVADTDFLSVIDTSAGATAAGNKKISLASLKSFLQTNLIPWITGDKWVTESRIGDGAVSLRALSGQVLEKLQEAGIKGLWSAASGSFPSGAVAGDQYIVTVAGTVGGQAFSVGDTLLALVNSPSTSVYAANWLKVTRFVIERGSNANGDYVKFSDGTMICQSPFLVSTGVTTAVGSTFYSDAITWTFPAPFLTGSPPVVKPGNCNDARCWEVIAGVTVAQASVRIMAPLSIATAVQGRASAEGRWF